MAYDLQRRNQLARDRGFVSYREQRRHRRDINDRAELDNLPNLAQQTRRRGLDAIATVRRDGVDLATAAARHNVTPDAVRWWAPGVVDRSRGRFTVAAADRLFRPMYVYSDGRVVNIDVRGSRVASNVGRYHSAVRHYLETGGHSRLDALRGVRVAGVELETDLDVIDELARRGSFDFESIYRVVA